MAHSQSTQRRVPLSLESRPRGGDWSGLYFDNEIFLSAVLSTVMDASRSPDIIAGRALTNSKCGLLCAQQKSTYAFLPFSFQACSTKTPRPSLFNVKLHITKFIRQCRPPAALQCAPEPPAAEQQYQFSCFSKQYALLITPGGQAKEAFK